EGHLAVDAGAYEMAAGIAVAARGGHAVVDLSVAVLIGAVAHLVGRKDGPDARSPLSRQAFAAASRARPDLIGPGRPVVAALAAADHAATARIVTVGIDVVAVRALARRSLAEAITVLVVAARL